MRNRIEGFDRIGFLIEPERSTWILSVVIVTLSPLGMKAMLERRVAVIGAGYVGLTTSACLASLGHHVVCADVDTDKVKRLDNGEVDILEPGLAELVGVGLAKGRLSFVVGAAAAAVGIEVLFLCVPTPMGIEGAADLSMIESVIEEVRELLKPGCIVVIKSTVPVGTTARIVELLNRIDLAVVNNPEFLRAGSAVHDILNPDRIVIGAEQQDAADGVAALYAGLDAPIIHTSAASAELAKYAANCFLAMKISYVNALAELCERLGADIADVTKSMSYDHRIGQEFLTPGPGWGGSCLPKDAAAMLQVADAVDYDFRLVRAAINTNTRQRHRVVEKIRVALTGACDGSLSNVRIGLLGLTFKAGTDDMRDSPALAVAELLRQAGAILVGYDPAVSASPINLSGIHLVPDPYQAATGADAVIVLTEWSEFRDLEWLRMASVARRPVVVDTRNLLDPQLLHRAGLIWTGMGRASAYT